MASLNTLGTILTQPPLWLALIFALALAGIAWQMRWLTRGGALAALIVGSVIFGLGGGKFAVPLLAFFVSSSLLSRIGQARKAAATSRAAKGATRDAGQVWANGGVAVAVVLLYALVVHHWPVYHTRTLLMAYLAALATVNADTWATEIGGLSRAAPRLLTHWRAVPAGTSGAITGLGVLAALAGAAFIPLSALWTWNLDGVEFLAVAWAGFIGALADSILGAGVQAQYRHQVTGELRETPSPGDKLTVRVRGFAWINNDMVNFLASLIGAACAWGLIRFAAFPFR